MVFLEVSLIIIGELPLMIKKKEDQKKNTQKPFFSTFFNDLDTQMKGFAQELKSSKETEEDNKKVS